MAGKKIANMIKSIVYLCSGIVLVYVLFTSILSTCIIGTDATGSSHTYYVHDYPMIHLLFFFILMGFIYWMKNKARKYQSYDKGTWMVIVCWGIIASLWVLCNTEKPMHDPANVLLAARQMRQYNFSSFTGDGYLNVWTGNRSLTLFFYLLSFVIGVDNYVVLRLMNVVAVMIIFLLIYKIVGEMWEKGKRIAFCSVLLCAGFIPLLMYTTFIYGDLYGLCLAVMAVFAQQKCFVGGYQLKWTLLSAAFISVSVSLKMNYLIILIAMIAAVIYNIFLTGNWKKALIYLVVLSAVTGGIKIGSDRLLEHITKMDKNDGVPYEAWIAMGLQEGVSAAGNYNGYNREVYVENGYDSQNAKEEAKKNIRESLSRFQDKPKYAISFFTRKIASQWNNPGCGVLNNGTERISELPWFVNSVQTGVGKNILRQFLNIFQVWMLLGAVVYIVMRKDKTDYEWIFFLIFLGGFAFHLFWEAGSRYAFPYYLLLIPYGSVGLLTLERKLESIVVNQWKEKTFKEKYHLLMICFLLIMAVSVLPYTGFLNNIIYFSEEKEVKKSSYITDGYYLISPVENEELHLTETDNGVMLMNEDNMLQIISIYRMYQHSVIRFMSSQNSLELAGGGDVCSMNPDNAFEWQLVRAADRENGYYILMDDETALTYSLEDWTVKLGTFSEGDSRQIWIIAEEGGRRFAQ